MLESDGSSGGSGSHSPSSQIHVTLDTFMLPIGYRHRLLQFRWERKIIGGARIDCASSISTA